MFTDITITRNLDKASINIASINEKLNNISDKMGKGRGLIGKLPVNSVFSKNLDIIAENIKKISNNFEQITYKLNKGVRCNW